MEYEPSIQDESESLIAAFGFSPLSQATKNRPGSKCLLEEFFLISESGPHAGPVDPHCISEVGKRSPFVSPFPKDSHRCIQRGRRIEPTRTPHLRIASHRSHTIHLIHIWIEKIKTLQRLARSYYYWA
jgi:hypothetical protein